MTKKRVKIPRSSRNYNIEDSINPYNPNSQHYRYQHKPIYTTVPGLDDESSNTVQSLNDPEQYFLRRGDIAHTLLLDFQKNVLNSPRLKPIDGEYAKPREDRLRILNFMEEEIHKLRRSY